MRNASGILQGSPLLKLRFKEVATGSRNVTKSHRSLPSKTRTMCYAQDMQFLAFLGTESCSESSGADNNVLLLLVLSIFGLVSSLVAGYILVLRAKKRDEPGGKYLTVPVLVGVISLVYLVSMLLVSGIQSKCT